MPAKNSIKVYVKNGYYHLYNRGVNKAPIFFDESDYRTFLHLLKLYLSNPSESKQILLESSFRFLYVPKNFFGEITLVAFVLMPNHFHLLVQQSNPRSIESFMRALMIKYVLYIKKKYERVGPLFQSSYKGALVTHDTYLLHLSRYIHRNPESLNPKKLLFSNPWYSYANYPFSSYQWYIRNIRLQWFNPRPILDFFSKRPVCIPKNMQSYQSFVSNYKKAYPDKLKRTLIDL